MGRLSKITPENESAILALYEEKDNLREVAEAFDMSSRTLSRWFKSKGIELKKGRRYGKIYSTTSPLQKWVLEHPGEVLEGDVTSIARAFNIPKQHVWNYLNRTERKLAPILEKDKAYYREILAQKGMLVRVQGKDLPVSAFKKIAFIRKKYTRKVKLKLTLRDGGILLTELFDELSYGDVLKY